VSYDLYLLRKDEIGQDPAAAYERLEELEEREPTEAEEEQLRQLAADLQAANPGLDLTEPEHGFLLQLGYETERPVVIDIGADEISMSWSYGAEDAGPALEDVRRYLPVFDRHGYVAYDPQLETVFDPDRDSAEAAELHRSVQEQVIGRYDGLGDERQSWWRRLFS
jgi:hypothetical protein